MAEACAFSGNAAGTISAVPIGFHVSGRYVVDINGVNFIMRGINHPHTWLTEHTSGFQHIKAKGANTVRVVLSRGSPFTLLAGESTRQSFTNINSGPVEIVSTVPIVAAERLIYKVNNLPGSFTEMMALPDNQLDTTLWFPWYNKVDLDTQLRFGIP